MLTLIDEGLHALIDKFIIFRQGSHDDIVRDVRTLMITIDKEVDDR